MSTPRFRAPRRAGAVLGPLALLAALVGSVLAPAAAGAAVPAPRLAAAECGMVDLEDSTALAAHAESADEVFVGEVVAIRRTGSGGGASGGDSSESAQGTGTESPGSSQSDGSQDSPRTVMRAWRHKVEVEAGFTGLVDAGSSVWVTIMTPSTTGGTGSSGTTDGTESPGDSGTGTGTGTSGVNDNGSLRAGATYLFFAVEDGNRLVADACGGAVLLRDGLTDELEKTLTDTLDPAAPAGVDPNLTMAEGAAEDPPELTRIVAPGAAVALVGLLGLLLVSRAGRERHR